MTALEYELAGRAIVDAFIKAAVAAKTDFAEGFIALTNKYVEEHGDKDAAGDASATRVMQYMADEITRADL